MGVGGFQGDVSSFFETGGAAGNVNGFGDYKDAPAVPATDGDTWTSEDSPVSKIGVAGAWKDGIEGWGYADPIPTAGWTPVGAAYTVEATRGLRQLTSTAGAGTGGHTRLPGTASFRIEAICTVRASTTSGFGASVAIGLEDTANTDSLNIQLAGQATGEINLFCYRRPNGLGSNVGQTAVVNLGPSQALNQRIWLAIEYDAANVGTEIKMEISTNGFVWENVLTEAVGTSFPLGTPTAWGYTMDGASTRVASSTLYLFRELPL